MLSNSKEQILPHYLRASMGSCHDFCKYGRQHTFESEGKHRILPIFSGSTGIPEKGKSRVKILNLAERQKKTARQKASAHQKTELSDSPEIYMEKVLSPMEAVECTETQIIVECMETQVIYQDSLSPEKINSSESSECIECNFPLPSEKIVLLEEFETIKQDTHVEKIGLYDDPETLTQKAIPLLEKTKVSEDSETANKKKTSVKQIHLSKGPASGGQRTQSAKKVFVSVKHEVKKKDISPVKTVISLGLPKVSKRDTLSNRLDPTARPALSGKSRITTVKSVSPKNPSTVTARRKTEIKGAENVKLSKSHEKKVLKPTSTSLSPRSPLNQVSKITKSTTPLRHPRKVGKTLLDFDNMKEKTLYVIEPRSTRDGNLQSEELKTSSCQPSVLSSSSSSSSLLSFSPSISDHKEGESQGVGPASIKPCSISVHGEAKVDKVGQKGHRRMGTAHSEDKDPTPYKLAFRRGKVMNPQSDNTGTRRLRFRQGRMLGDDQSGKREVEKRSFRRKQWGQGAFNHPDSNARTVVLRHQDVQDKKDAPDLFNQIIEETASKLVKTRKSKVKALVGAFETLISLQDSKPAASI